LNINENNQNKICANQAQEDIKKIIHQDQGGLVPGMQGWPNICKSINIITAHRIKDRNHMIF
jgi:hypothetical protein